MQINVQLFATIKERVGQSNVMLELGSPATVGSLLDELVRLYPAISPSLHSLIISVNQEFAELTKEIHAEDEVALFPPVSGG